MTTPRQHTPGPWLVLHGSVYAMEGSVRIAGMDRAEASTRPTERDANARRIVACVNACEGMNDPATEIQYLLILDGQAGDQARADAFGEQREETEND